MTTNSTESWHNDFVKIDQNSLISDDAYIDFDIFIQTSSKPGKKPVLLFEKNSNIKNIKSLISKKKYKSLFIKKENIAAFQRFVENNIFKIISNPYLSVEDKSKITYRCSLNVLQDIFINPRSGKNLKRVKNIVNNIIDFILQKNDSLIHLLYLGSHDYYTFSHSVNVAVFSIGLRQIINRYNDDDLHEFALGAILHDIGKSQIDDNILKKPGKLTEEEFEIIKQHPVYGCQLMEEKLSPLSLDIIMHHHEKYTGKGYPDGLKGDEISDYAKIVSIADVYDALTTNRPYAPARKPFYAVSLMKDEMANQFEKHKFMEFIRFLGHTSIKVE
ncbi:MAG: HD-GYP domain-containing protein [Desulfobia sp.]